MTPLKADKDVQSARERGFTLIELLIVIVILAVLSGITVFAVSNFTSSGTDSACQADYKTVQVAVETFKSQENSYPNSSNPNQAWMAQSPYSSYDAVPALQAKDPGPPTGNIAGLGPWLLGPTTNGHHYRIEAALDGSGTVKVMAWNDTDGTNIIGTPAQVGTVAPCAQTH
jgi:prepilin-type N-terminal cleavage/methylation domain-containing protein